MILIMLAQPDGATAIGPIVPDDFDVRAWAEARAASFRLLNITRVYVRNIPITTGGDS